MKYMAKRVIACAMVLAVLGTAMLPVCAAQGNVTYSGDAGQFIFAPGSDQSPSDLFPDFKDVMPGDTLTQTILVRNNASDKVSVKLYLRALGGHEESREFLSQLTLVVSAGDNLMFHAPADRKAQLDDWVALGEFGPGGETELTVTLQVPVELDNRFMDAVGYLDWQFMAEEHVKTPDAPDTPDTPDTPDEPSNPDQPQKPDVPKTGDSVNIGLAAGLFAGSGVLLPVVLWLLLKKKKKNND